MRSLYTFWMLQKNLFSVAHGRAQKACLHCLSSCAQLNFKLPHWKCPPTSILRDSERVRRLPKVTEHLDSRLEKRPHFLTLIQFTSAALSGYHSNLTEKSFFLRWKTWSPGFLLNSLRCCFP